MVPDLPRFTLAMAEDSAPASGSAAAMGVAMAAALAQKVADRSRGLASASEISERVAVIRIEALDLVDADHRAVQEMLAQGEPGAEAVQVPRRIFELAGELVSIARVLEESGNAWLLADSIGVRELSQAAAGICEAILQSNDPGADTEA